MSLKYDTPVLYEPDHQRSDEQLPGDSLAYQPVLLLGVQPLMLAGLREALNRTADFKVTGEARTPAQALGVLSRRPVNLLIIDQARPGAVLPWLQQLQPVTGGRVAVVILGSSETYEEIANLRTAGADFFVSKEAEWRDIHRILLRTLEKPRAVNDGTACAPVRGVPAAWPVESAAPAIKPFKPLSRREIEILSIIARGYTNKDVAEILCISGHTLKNHLNNIFKKLEVEDRTQALMLGLRQGWVQL